MFDVNHPATTFLFILIPLAVTFVGQRLFLHLINPDADLYILGHNVHHLFVGAAMVIPRLSFWHSSPRRRSYGWGLWRHSAAVVPWSWTR